MFRLHHLKGSHVGCYCLSSIIIMGFSQIELGMALPTTIWLPCYFSKFCKFSLNLSIFWWYKTYFVRHDVFGKHVMSEHLPELKMKTIGCTPPKTSRPALLYNLEVWLIKKKKWKIALACLFFVVDALIWCLSQQISVKKRHFYQELRDLGAFYFVSSTVI